MIEYSALTTAVSLVTWILVGLAVMFVFMIVVGVCWVIHVKAMRKKKAHLRVIYRRP